MCLRFIIVLALVQIRFGSYAIWYELTLTGSLNIKLLVAACMITVGGILALSVVPLRYRAPSVARTSTVIGGLMGLAVGHPGYLLVPFLLAVLGLLTYSRPPVGRDLVTDD